MPHRPIGFASLLLAVLFIAPGAAGSTRWLSPAGEPSADAGASTWARHGQRLDLDAARSVIGADADAGPWLIDAGLSTDQPASVRFEVGAQARVLQFVHTYQPGEGIEDWRRAAALAKRAGKLPPQPPAVLRYTVRYTDGIEVPVVVRWRESIQDWYRFVDEPMPLPWAEALISATPDEVDGRSVADWSFRPHHAVYRMTWPNPRPQQAIESIEVGSAERPFEEHGRALVFAVGTTDADAPRRVRAVDPIIGDDAGPGTWDRPWQTPRHAFDQAQAGDLLLLRGGRYGITQTLAFERSGTEADPIVIASVPGETAVIDATYRPVKLIGVEGPRAEHDDGALEIRGVAHARMIGLEVSNSGGVGIDIIGSQHFDLLFCRTFQTFSSGIYDSRSQHLRVIGNTVARPNSKLAITGRTDQRLAVTNTPHEGITFGSSRHYEAGWNEVYFGDKEGMDSKGANRHGVKHHNYVHQTASVGIYVDCWNQYIEDIEIYRNTLFQTGAIAIGSEVQQSVHNIRIHHNLVYQSLKGINLFDPRPGESNPMLHDVHVWNNTLHDNGYQFETRGWTGGGIILSGSRMTDIEIKHNIVSDPMGVAMGATPSEDQDRDFRFHQNVIWPQVEDGSGDERWPEHHGDQPLYKAPSFQNPDLGLFFLTDDSPLLDDSIGFFPGAFRGQWRGDDGIDPNTQRVRLDYQGPADQQVVLLPPGLKNVNYGTKGSHRDWFYGGGMYHQDLLAMPTDRQSLAGIEWALPAHDRDPGPHAIMLGGHGSITEVDAVRGLPVAMKADQLHFLHTYNANGGLSQGEPVMQYVVHYADGSQAEIPVAWREQIGPWLTPTGEPIAIRDGRVAWYYDYTRRRPRDSFGDRQIALYAMTWRNPHPDREVRSIDVVSLNTPERDLGSGALLAVTATRAAPSPGAR